jgi:TPM domain
LLVVVLEKERDTLMSNQSPFAMRWLRKGLLAITAVLVLLLVSACGGSNSVHVYDNAGVLDQSKVQNEASSLQKPMDIYTVNTFSGTKPQFDQATRAKLGNNPDLIVMAVDTVHRHLAIVRGSNVQLSSNQISSAVNAFASNYGNGDYTGATIATIDSLRNSLGTSVGPSGGGIFSGLLGTLCIGGLVILGAILLFGVLFRRRRGFGGFNRPPVYQQPPYNQGYPPNYYGQGYNQGPGMNPWAAGGLGAAAGGFLGYELGKEAGERDAQQQGQGDGGWAGASGDFGGGGDSGGGGDFGGGGGGDFGGGGGGDFGGGGGDFGGGGGGDF